MERALMDALGEQPVTERGLGAWQTPMKPSYQPLYAAFDELSATAGVRGLPDGERSLTARTCGAGSSDSRA